MTKLFLSVMDLRGGPDLSPAAWRHDKASDGHLSTHGDTIKFEQLNFQRHTEAGYVP